VNCNACGRELLGGWVCFQCPALQAKVELIERAHLCCSTCRRIPEDGPFVADLIDLPVGGELNLVCAFAGDCSCHEAGAAVLH
jgi:hypothetical protein